MQLCFRFQFSFLLFVLFFCICLSLCTLSGRRTLLVFMVYAALNCNVLIHFPVLRILLHTCLEKRNQVMMKAHLFKWLKSDTRYFSATLRPLLVLKNRKCLYPSTEVWLDFNTWISSSAYYLSEQRSGRASSVYFPFEKHFLRGRGKQWRFSCLNYLLQMLLEALYLYTYMLFYIYYY